MVPLNCKSAVGIWFKHQNSTKNQFADLDLVGDVVSKNCQPTIIYSFYTSTDIPIFWWLKSIMIPGPLFGCQRPRPALQPTVQQQIHGGSEHGTQNPARINVDLPRWCSVEKLVIEPAGGNNGDLSRKTWKHGTMIVYMYIHMHVYVCMYVYIYIDR